MNEAERQIQRINDARRARGEASLPVVGYDYAEAMAVLVQAGYKNDEIASGIGYAPGSGKMVDRIMTKGTVPSHIQGEALAGWCVDILMKSGMTEAQAWERLTSPAQRLGGTHPLAGKHSGN